MDAVFWSRATGGFYVPAVHGASIPADVVELSAEEHQALLAGQASGLEIRAGDDGRPVAAERVLSVAEQAAAARRRRDHLLAELDRVVSNPLRWSGMSADQQGAWATYRQELLAVPQQPGFPSSIDWPEVPA